jgi:hypothetical protein
MEENTNVNVESTETVEVEGGATETTEIKTSVKEEKTFTQEDLDKILNKKFAQWKKKEEETKEEAAKLAKMSEQERQEALFEKQVKEFEETKKAFENEKLLNETTRQLAAKNLPVQFAGWLKGADAESTLENIKVFEAKFSEALENKVNEHFKKPVPKLSHNNEQIITKEVFNKMSYSERVNLLNTNKELYNQLNSN